jgi:hypothetical protein
MLRILFSFISFAVCTFWFCAFALNFRTNDVAKRLLTLFLATCSVLYFCHGLYFTIGLSHGQECLWTLCSLSVYPLYYIYICLLTSYRPSISKLMMLLGPGFVVAVVKYIHPTPEAYLARQNPEYHTGVQRMLFRIPSLVAIRQGTEGGLFRYRG